MNDTPRDARFADADEGPLRLRALDAGDLRVISALVQDAVVTVGEVAWMKGHRRFAALVNRFRWEGPTRTPERVRSLLVIEGVTAVRGAEPGPHRPGEAGVVHRAVPAVALQVRPGVVAVLGEHPGVRAGATSRVRSCAPRRPVMLATSIRQPSRPSPDGIRSQRATTEPGPS